MTTIKLYIDDIPRQGERHLQCRAYLYEGREIVGSCEVYTDNPAVFCTLAELRLQAFVRLTRKLNPETDFEVQFSYEACQFFQKSAHRMDQKRAVERGVMSAAIH